MLKIRKREGIINNEVVYAEFNELSVRPFFLKKSLLWSLHDIFVHLNNDKDFIRKHNFLNYSPAFKVDPFMVGDDVIGFYDLTESYLNTYLKYKSKAKNTINMNAIRIIEILERKNDLGMLKLFINNDYDNAVDFHKCPYLDMFYTLAVNKVVNYLEGFYTYFNSNKANPIYKRTGLSRTAILKKQGDIIVLNPKIPIVIRTQKYISQAKNKVASGRFLS